MKKPFLGLAVWFFLLAGFVYGQTVDKAQYKAIDPFDYKLDEEKAARGAVRKFKSVVQFVSQNGTVFSFSSLDQFTKLNVTANRHMDPPSAAQRVTIYFTATKGIIDALILDEIDTGNSTEAGIGLTKSTIPASSGIRKSDYKEIDPVDYWMDAEFAQRGEVRKYKSTVLFSSQNGISYSFVNTGDEKADLLTMKAGRRFALMTANQKVTIYYTATKGIVDSLFLDDIEF